MENEMQQQKAAARASHRKLEHLNFDNLTLRALPLDPIKGGPLVVASPEALALLDVDPAEIDRPDFAEYFCGNKLLPGAEAAAHCYCGHQFGYFSGQLGDGAAMYLGEVVNSRGERWELQFKGAGKTPYSRQADGRKVLRSSLREFLCSEAMYHLGVPTTRAGTCVTSDTRVVRDVFYDGNAILEKATIITRIAPTFLRFGSFEIFKPVDAFTGRRGSSAGQEVAMLPTLLHHTIRTYFPDIWASHQGDAISAGVGVASDGSGGAPWPPEGGLEVEARLQAMYLDWLIEVTRRTASLVAAWQCVGWCHGVLNTDNMSVVGVTLDYGPFGFLDRYDPDHICNGSDDSGRYDYKSQPDICRWNCEKLAEAIRTVLPEARGKRAVAETFDPVYRRTYLGLMRRKLGLATPREGLEGEMADVGDIDADAGEDEMLVSELLTVMEETGADFTNTFRQAQGRAEPSSTAVVEAGGVLDYILTQMLAMLAGKNPELLHQMGLTPQMLNAEMARLKRSEQLAKQNDEDKRLRDRERWAAWLASYGARLQRAMAAGRLDAGMRPAVMNATNPRFILRNWIAQQAIEKAEKGDFSEVTRVYALLRNPFSDEDVSELLRNVDAKTGTVAAAAAAAAAPGAAAAPPAGPEAASGTAAEPGVSCSLPVYDGRPPGWAAKLCVTCSS
ncbi:hypothetical protein VOLCADRAFT_106324 [Volvox carteri f. nagariensis]|uniref:Selenoprotein O n=1 Tax=Volvox carteri f. nagariensis TaxID=3068 RepID=D8U6K4_VOLCA|nr:uncharacterized protein VOLCADRAFT_106324 [Volvox carteri f. nagariensis]EFJ44662.1 hypothetical protein VOLCADRAFT_106324 [Volvox carteri f. nagariensis]|eukprot:XP_002954238.1 hypothetical protein VOLCADRAFT_106324 [Volvox carteri f. nagariensis]